MLHTILIVIPILLLLGTLPQWSHMRRFDLGWGPPGVAVLLLIVLLILMLAGKV